MDSSPGGGGASSEDVDWRRQGVHWKGPWKNGGCHEYGIQSYSADLLDIPRDLHWREVCEDMPMQIEGSPLTVRQPGQMREKCESDILRPSNYYVSTEGSIPHQEHGNVWATWFVRTNESQCVTY